MERLTDKNFRLGFDDSDKLPSYVAIYERLREYENLEEQGKLHIFPCAIGETVYCVYNKHQECDSKKEYVIQSQKVESLDWLATQTAKNYLGKTVFLTRQKAEEELQRRTRGE